jgi:thiosulfate/3-mercaptopyruvate sulfurtransferase
MEPLVSGEWLERELGAADLRVLDASYFLPGSGRDARAEHEAAHIPGAVFFDLDAVSDPSNPAPHMLPDARAFEASMRALGLGNGDRIVVYDNSPLHSAARAWWMLRIFGARSVAILDGGMQVWLDEGRLVESGARAVGLGDFEAVMNADAVADMASVGALLHSREHELVDARSEARFAGEEAEPRPGLAAGHIPGSRNLPQGRLFDSRNRWKQGEALRSTFGEAGVDLARPMVTTCGSGVTAAVLLFGAHLLGKEDVKLYDGSWSEWGADPMTPKATGRA